jgi:hypothetical protein
MQLSTIEDALLNREFANFTAQVSIGLEHIRKAFDRYMDRSIDGVRIDADSILASEIDEYLKKIKLIGSYYYGGNYLCINTEIANTKNIPDVLKNRMLQVATSEFLAQVERVKEITELDL